MLLWEEYRQHEPDGYRYSRWCELYRAWEGRLSPTMRQAHPAGERMFVDYAGQTVDVVDPGTGGQCRRGPVRWRAGSFFERDAFACEKRPYRAVAHLTPSAASSALIARNVRPGFSAIRASSQSRLLARRCGRRPPIARAAALRVVRKRCDHRTTVATLTLNIFAVARRERPPVTDATTRSRKSCE
jgi:hypothetical protein